MQIKVITAFWLLHFISSCAAFSLSPEQHNSKTITVHFLSSNNINSINSTTKDFTLYTYPATMYNIKEMESEEIMFDFVWNGTDTLKARFYLSDESVANLENPFFNFTTGNSALGTAVHSNSSSNSTVMMMRHKLKITGKFLGRSQLHLDLNYSSSSESSSSSSSSSFKYRISVVRKARTIDIAFRIVIWLFVVFANVGMGCEIDFKIVKSVLKKPFAPAIGFVSQYLFMPFISFLVLQVITMPGSTALGYFGVGCAPGGGASNFYCLLLAGDISLSITMTLISTLGAFGMTPLYMFTLGQLILSQNDVKIKIPYLNIVITLLMILIPSMVGYLLQLKLPRAAKIYRKILKPAILLFVLFMFTFGIYANLFIWSLFSPSVIAAGCALPYLGFILGGLLAFVCRQPWPRIKTICLETGIQNPGVPILLLQTSLPQPDADLSLVGPIAAATFTPFPLFIWVAVRIIYYKCYLKKSPFANEDEEAEVDGDAADAEIEEAETKVGFLDKSKD